MIHQNQLLAIQLFIATMLFGVKFCGLAAGQSSKTDSREHASLIDEFIDARFEGDSQDINKLISDLENAGVNSIAEIEKLVRQRRASYPDASEWIGKTTSHELNCLHVDYSSTFFLFVPQNVNFEKPLALVVVGHGGNSSMSKRRATSTAKSYIGAFARGITDNFNSVVVAPVSERGWGQIGNSLILSAISKVQRMLPIDPDRIYVTGQSMGGHLAYRSALSLPDRWGAVSPHSGGYDFVKKKTIENLINVPGYAVWGIREPYGINKDNRTNQKWAKENKLEWKFVEKNGGHEIYQDELPKVAKFFKSNPRNLYRDKVYLRSGGAMKFTKTWNVKGWPNHQVYHETKPLRWNLRHWVEVEPRPDSKLPIEVIAEYKGKNQFEIISRELRQFSILLHPKMVDFSKPVSVNVNGENVFNAVVKPDPGLLLHVVREFDDRGRIYWARIQMQVQSDSSSKWQD